MGTQGVIFLMNTGGIIDTILNSLAILFIVTLDSTIFQAFSKGQVQAIMGRLEPFGMGHSVNRKVVKKLYPTVFQKADPLLRHCSRSDFGYFWKLVCRLFAPVILCFVAVYVSVFGYFCFNCTMTRAPFHGQWITRP